MRGLSLDCLGRSRFRLREPFNNRPWRFGEAKRATWKQRNKPCFIAPGATASPAVANTPPRWKWSQSSITQEGQCNMKTPVEYTIVAVPFHADAATHDELARKVNEKLASGYELYGQPFISEEMMYQTMTKPIPSD
jgi:hypothetical protein